MYPYKLGSKQGVSWENNLNFFYKLNTSITKVEIPQYNYTKIDENYNGYYHFHFDNLEPQQITIDFKDYDEATLYRKLLKIFHETKGQYFDNARWIIQVFLKDKNNNPSTLIFETENALLHSFAQLQLSNEDDAQILNFSAEFTTTPPKYTSI